MKKSNVSIGLINPKSPENVSSVMRSAGNFQVDNVFYSGSRYPRAVKHYPSTVNMSRKVGQAVPLTELTHIIDDAPAGMKLVCVELAENAIPLPDYQHPEHAFYIFGPEDGSITQDVIDRADAVVYIPTVGCMNLAATVNVVLYDRLMKSGLCFESDELIRANRDINNTLKVSR